MVVKFVFFFNLESTKKRLLSTNYTNRKPGKAN